MANVTPGIVWTSGETVTPTKLNAAAAPAVTLANNEVTTGSILDGAVTNAKLASGIDAGKLTAGTLPMARIADGAVVNAKLGNDLDAGKLTAGTLPIARIADGAVTNNKLSLAANAGEIKKAINADNDPPIYACRAWVNFNSQRNQSDTAASSNGANVLVVGSGNVASVLKNSTGNFTITFTTPMPDANYAVTVSTNPVSNIARNFSVGPVSLSAGSVTVACESSDGAAVDQIPMCVAIFR